MDIICNNCMTRLKIPDGKIPLGKTASFQCPKCHNKITVNAAQKTDADKQKEAKEQTEYNKFDSEAYDAYEKPFDFAEEEGDTVLVCETDPDIRRRIKETLNVMEYHISESENVRDALSKIRYHNYDLILVNENFDTDNPDLNGVLIYLERINISSRRNIFTVLLSNRFRTMDTMMAFHKSVNIIINIDDIKDIGKIINRGITDKELFYSTFKEVLRETGRI